MKRPPNLSKARDAAAGYRCAIRWRRNYRRAFISGICQAALRNAIGRLVVQTLAPMTDADLSAALAEFIGPPVAAPPAGRAICFSAPSGIDHDLFRLRSEVMNEQSKFRLAAWDEPGEPS